MARGKGGKVNKKNILRANGLLISISTYQKEFRQRSRPKRHLCFTIEGFQIVLHLILILSILVFFYCIEA